ncbi:hypothetical protein H6F94_05290 [Leptolyngbya sp. FACHB-261]|nr:hypothetical protein [Leptolyngbya sp. FACHB-261]
MRKPEDIQEGDKVQVICPNYLAGQVGVVLCREVRSDGRPSKRWLIQLEGEDILVSLCPEELQILSH